MSDCQGTSGNSAVERKWHNQIGAHAIHEVGVVWGALFRPDLFTRAHNSYT